MPICRALLYLTKDIILSPTEQTLLEPLQHLANRHVSILDDVLSCNREWAAAQKLEEQDPVVERQFAVIRRAAIQQHRQVAALRYLRCFRRYHGNLAQLKP